MLDYYTIFAALGVVSLEIFVLVLLYRNYITSWNADKWSQKAREEGFLTDILAPVIESVTSATSDNVIEKLKYEMLSSQGTMARQVMADNNIESPEDMMVHVSDSLLKSIGYKNPNPLITMKLAQGLGVLAEKTLKNNNKSNGSTDNIKVGQDLFN